MIDSTVRPHNGHAVRARVDNGDYNRHDCRRTGELPFITLCASSKQSQNNRGCINKQHNKNSAAAHLTASADGSDSTPCHTPRIIGDVTTIPRVSSSNWSSVDFIVSVDLYR